MSRLPAVRDGLLRVTPHDAPIPVGTPQWFAWLLRARSFTFAGDEGTFTARQEERSGRRFWYAYRQQQRSLRKTYLGRSEDLTAARLAEAARTLAGQNGARGDAAGARSSSLIATKIAMPQPGQALVARPAIEARCLESVERPCAIVTAPAGFGKTTLLLVTCARLKAQGWRIAWVSLEEAETDPVRFWRYALAALDSAQPGIGVIARRMLETPRPAPIEQTLTAVVNALAEATTPIALVLDDYHRAATPAHDHALAFLIEHAPATLHLIITARSMPDLPLTRLRAQGRLAALNAADLRFSTDDAGRFLRETMRVSLAKEQVAQLNARTEGWVAGLQLAALSLREQDDAPDLIADLSTTPRYIAEYLIGEALECQPPEIQTFLLETAPLERLCGPLCDAVTGRTDGAATLARLTQAQLFLTPLDNTQTWYRYHHLFAEVLRERLQRTEPGALERSHRRAAEWLRSEGLIDEAITHFLAAQAPDEAATLIEGACDRLVLRGELAGLIAWARALPYSILLAHPHLCALFALGLVLQGGVASAEDLLNTLEEDRAEQGAHDSEIEGEIAVARAILRVIEGDFIGGADLAREAEKRLSPGDHLLRALAMWITNIIGVMSEADFSATTRALSESAEECALVGNIFVAFIALIARAAIEIFQGHLHRAAQTCREALRLAPQTDGQELPITVMAHCLLGEIYREKNDLDSAESELRIAMAGDMRLISPEFIMDGLITLAMTQAARGRPDESLETFEEIRRLILTHSLNPWDIVQMEVMRMRVLIAQGRLDEATRWAEASQRRREEQSPLSALALLREMEDLALARVTLAQWRPTDLISSLTELCAQATRAGRLRNALEAHMLLARTHWLLGEREPALRELEASLAIAAPEGFTRLFLDEGEGMADLLAAYVARRTPSRERTHALTLLAAFGRAAEPAAEPMADALSPRELDVLRLLASGRSNEAIASDLVVALSTVKWHVAHIYRKLGVTRRTQAILRARELRLIA